MHRILVGSLLAGATILGPAAAWAFTATLSVPGLCASPVQVQAFSTETSNTVSFGSGSGGGAGKATIKPLVLTKAVDDCTPLLFKAAFTGQHVPAATLQVGTNRTPMLFTIQLSDVFVIDLKHDFSRMGPGPADDVLTETLTLDAAALSFTSGGSTVRCDQTTNTCQ
ncbi:MAG TPA: type VI secretion system tube protein Hcp [Methylomirabilota bacterium]|nr:type VI secretion system tube protein Hcp [Methylomirabilota bacterium]